MPKLTYYGETTVEGAPEGKPILDISIEHKIPHIHQCGGMAKCTTCRVQIIDGLSNLTPRSAIEQKIAQDRDWDETTRLGCQARVQGDVVLRRLLNNSQDIVVLDFEEMQAEDSGEGHEIEVAILFADIRNFTTYSENQLPFDVLHILNSYFNAAVEPILNNNGYVDKYLGDGLLAVFGARGEPKEDICRNAVRSALGMTEAAERLSPNFEEQFSMPLQIGVGIHFGKVIIGRMGYLGKRQVTVIGDTVNTASRVEEATKALNAKILITEDVVRELQGVLKLGSAKPIQLKGKSEPTNLYPCLGFAKPDPIGLVQSSLEQLMPRASEFSETFYDKLFLRYPEMRDMFKGDMAQQSKMLFSILASAVKGLNRMDEIEGGLKLLGKRHANYGVTHDDFSKLRKVLTIHLEEFLAPNYTPELEQAWQTVLETIVKPMIKSVDDAHSRLPDSNH